MKHRFCSCSLKETPFEVAASYSDGAEAVRCLKCSNTTILHQCSAPSTGLAGFWPSVLELGLRQACPRCFQAYDLASEVQNLPDAPPWVQPLAEIVKIAAVGFAIGAAVNLVSEIFASART